MLNNLKVCILIFVYQFGKIKPYNSTANKENFISVSLPVPKEAPKFFQGFWLAHNYHMVICVNSIVSMGNNYFVFPKDCTDNAAVSKLEILDLLSYKLTVRTDSKFHHLNFSPGKDFSIYG